MSCAECHGCGQKVYVYVDIDPVTSKEMVRHVAGTCDSCGGRGET